MIAEKPPALTERQWGLLEMLAATNNYDFQQALIMEFWMIARFALAARPLLLDVHCNCGDDEHSENPKDHFTKCNRRKALALAADREEEGTNV